MRICFVLNRNFLLKHCVMELVKWLKLSFLWREPTASRPASQAGMHKCMRILAQSPGEGWESCAILFRENMNTEAY